MAFGRAGRRPRRASAAVREEFDEPIAIVGMACRYPGDVRTVDEFWDLIAAGRDGVTPFPTDRGWDLDAIFGPELDTVYRPEGGFVSGMADFDADFFGISPREALTMDPQQRLLLETSWEALEHAGIDPLTLRGEQAGVFAGLMYHDYALRLAGTPDYVAGFVDPGIAGSVVSGRIAYTLGLTGPAVTVDTACSSSLVALHWAVQALRNGECSMALAGGVTVMSTPGAFAGFARQGGLAGDGRCKSYAGAADGTGWGEGVGVLVVERLSDARRLGHRVWGVVRGSAVNQDGASNGLTAPNGPSQERVIVQALADAGLGASDVDLVEGHGTGTRLGDPIEAQALLATYGRERADAPLWLGSVKSNIGHTQAAAGVAGIIKTVQAMRHEVMPATLHVDEPSPQVDWSAGGVELLTEAREWRRAAGRPRRAGVSSFGISGTNAHVIVEEGDPEPVGAVLPVPSGGVVWGLSAKSEGALRAQASRLAQWTADGDEGLVETGLALARRSSFAHRAVVIGQDRESVVAGLRSVAAGDANAISGAVVPGVSSGGVSSSGVSSSGVLSGGVSSGGALVFPGQGWQRVGVGAGLLAGGVFAEAIAECGEALRQWVDFDLVEVLSGSDDAWLARVDVVQPVLWAVMVGLARVWESLGVAPPVVVGHSQGEIAAAVVAGALSVEDGARVVAVRSRVIREHLAGSGAMASVAASAAEVESWLVDGVSIAAVNGPAAVTVAGEREAVLAFAAEIEVRGVRVRVVDVDYASHSPMVAQIEDVLRRELAGLTPRKLAPGRRWLSTVTGQWMTGTEADAEYWYRNLRQQVGFSPAVEQLVREGHRLFVEASGHPVLTSGIEQIFEASGVAGAVSGTLRRDVADPTGLLTSAARLFTAGVPIEWPRLLSDATDVLKPSVPPYAFERSRYWVDGPIGGVGDIGAVGLSALDHPLLGASVALADGGCVLTGRLSVTAQPWLADHAVSGTVLLAGTALVELALRAGEATGHGLLRELTLQAPVVLPESGALQLQVTVGAPAADGVQELSIHTRPAGQDSESTEWTCHANGLLAGEGQHATVNAALFAQWPPLGAEPLSVEGLYERLAEIGVGYGPSFRALQRAWRRDDEVLAEVALPDQASDEDRFGLHPVLLDAALQAWALADARDSVRMPFVWSDVRLAAVGARSLRVRVASVADGGVSVLGVDDAGDLVVSAASMVSRPVDAEQVRSWGRSGAADGLLALEWVPAQAAAGAEAVAEWMFVPTGGGADQVADVVWEVLERVRHWLSNESEGRLGVVTRGAVGEPVTDVAAAAVWGLIRSMQAENPGRLLLVDIEIDTEIDSATGDLAAIVSNLGDDDQAAVRDGVLLVPRLVRTPASVETEADPTWDPAGTVLVTGGTGGLGRHVLRHLATTHGIRSLLILSRSGPSTPEALTLAAELAALGVRVRLIAGDVADREFLADALAGVPQRWPLRGVVHVAGLVDDGVALSLTRDQVDRVLRVKAGAALALHELTADLPLTAFALFSSAAAILGAGGQANYAAGNAFLDGFASWRRSQGLPATSMAWGLWDEQRGMGGRLGQGDRKRLQQLAAPLSVEHGLELFDAALANAAPMSVPLRFNAAFARTLDPVPPLLRSLVRGAPRRAVSSNTGTPGGAGLATRLAVLDPETQLTELLTLVRTHVASVLRHDSADRVDVENTFKGLGFDSLTAVELRNSLQAALGRPLSATVVFDHPHPRELAEHLRDQLPGGSRRSVVVQAAAVADEPIAIVGMACRFPGGATTPEEFWQLLAQGRDAVTGFPTDRGWDVEGIYDPEPLTPGRTYARHGAFLHDAAQFDAAFFGISPREALAMDPQQRLLLETSWEALEQAGVEPDTLRGSATGVFVGTNGQDYGRDAVGLPDEVEGYVGIGSSASVMSGRVSYVLGLTGPAVTVDTACSSSLVALHLAAQALRSGECSMALTGGVTVMAKPWPFVEFSRQQGLSADGRCKAFAAGADGFGMAEGIGMLVVERLSEARKRGHRVLGLVRGSAVNQDGASNGLTAPNGPSQERVILQALANAGLETQDVDLVEGHGTGTTLGDPIEAQALLATYGQGRTADEPLWLGSVKSNIGHTQAAAGVAGIIKTVLALRHELMPPTLHVDEPTSQVDWSAGDVELLARAREWRRTEGRPRRAGVSSFGISGTNAHIIVEEGDPEPAVEGLPSPAGGIAWALSAKSEAALRAQASRLAQWATDGADRAVGADDADGAGGDDGLVETGLALARRSRFAHRAVVVGQDRRALVEGLRSIAAGDPTSIAGTALPDVSGGGVLVFPGQGWQRIGVGAGMLTNGGVFAETIAECGAALRQWTDFDLVDVLFGSDEAWLGRVDVVQPVLWAVMVGLARMWESLGVAPSVVVGHSQGEIAAAVVAGALSVEDGARVVAVRSRVIRDHLAGSGAMASIAASAADVETWLSGAVSIAAVNGPGAVTVAGEREAVLSFAADMEAREVRVRVVDVDYASHSPMVEQIEDVLRHELAGLSPREPAPGRRWLSTVTGQWMTGLEADADYWYRNLRQQVAFAPAVEQLMRDGHRLFVEASGHPVLTSGIEQLFDLLGESGAVSGTLRRDLPDANALLVSAARLFTAGAPIAWPKLLTDGPDADSDAAATAAGQSVASLTLPPYAFDRARYWLESQSSVIGDVAAAGLVPTGHPLLGAAVPLADGGCVLTGRLSVATQPWLADHAVSGTVLLAGAALVELALRAAQETDCGGVGELTLQAPVVLSTDSALQVRLTVSAPAGAQARSLTIHTRPENQDTESEWMLHAAGSLVGAPEQPGPDVTVFEQWPPRGADPLPVEGMYDRLADIGVEYGPSFRALRRAWSRDGEVFAEVALDDANDTDRGFGLDPVLLDAALQAWALADGGDGVRMPFAWSDVHLTAIGARSLRVRISADATGVGVLGVDDAGDVVISVGSMVSRPVETDQVRAWGRGTTTDGLLGLEWIPVPPAQQAATPETPTEWIFVPEGQVADVVWQVLEQVQEWLRGDPAGRLAVVTRGAVGDTVTDLGGSAVWGLIRTVQSEHPGRLVLVDTDSESTPEHVAPLLAELGDAEQAAIRSGAVLVPRLTRIPTPTEPATSWDPNSTVLITGVTGGLGRHVARHLVRTHGIRSLLLVSRSGPAAPDALALAAELSGLGARVRLTAADAAETSAVRDLLTSVPSHLPLRGVVHVAGVVDDALALSLTRPHLDRVFRVKVDAAWTLHQLTADLPLTAFVLFSGAAGILGGAGQANYAAGNAYLDGLAAWRHAQGLPATSLAWGLWDETHGMGGRLTASERQRLQRFAVPLSVNQGLELFDSGVATGLPLVVPLRLDPTAVRRLDRVPDLLRGLVRDTPRRAVTTAGAVSSAAAHGLAAELSALDDEAQLRELLALVRIRVAGVLGHTGPETVDADESFKVLGVDSLMAVEVRNTLAAAIGFSLPATLVFDHPSPRALARYLRDRLPGAVSGVSTTGPKRTPSKRNPIPVDEPIAIVGMACRFPGGADTPEAFWQLLADGADAMTGFPTDRGWSADAIAEPDDSTGPAYARRGAFLHRAGDFDAGFFGISPNEALAMDPQQRLLLETAWEALERAGIDPEALRDTDTGVFIGTNGQDYGRVAASDPGVAPEVASHLGVGSSASVMSGRVSYTLGLTGPAVTVDTACSSSLVALHWAAQALRNGECALALTGGVTVMATPMLFPEFASQGGMAADGRCKSFAGAADGTGWGEGVGMLAVELLSDARRLGHRVLGVVRGSAVNQDGASNGLTAPNGPSQERVIRQAIAAAGISAAAVDLVEGHGTGTKLGDPIEAQALLATYGRDRSGGPLWLGSVKSNIGHTQAAAGVAGVIKTVLAMQNAEMPVTLHVDEPSPHVDWSDGDVRLLTGARAWPRDPNRARLAGVSSFGISGTNAHVVIEEGDPNPEPSEQPLPVPAGGVAWLLSSRSGRGLRGQASRLAQWAADSADGIVESGLALATRRARLAHRATVVGADRAELVERLRLLAEGVPAPGLFTAPGSGAARLDDTDGGVAALFSGQGSQRAAMGLGLHGVAPVFTEILDLVCAELGLDLDTLGDAERLNRTEITQRALFAIQVATFRQLEAWGLTVSWLGGHSIGELTAAYLAGVWDLEGACRIVAARGRLMGQARAGGAMAALEATEAQVLEDLATVDGHIGLAAVNGPTSAVVSGDAEAVEALVASYKAAGRRARRLTVSHAFHSAHMDDALAGFERIVASVPASAPRLRLVSTLTGLELDDQATDPGYWVRQLREPVRFADAVTFLARRGVAAFVDVSPDGVLTSMISGALPEEAAETPVVPTLSAEVPEPVALLHAAAALDVVGAARIAWPTVLAEQSQPAELETEIAGIELPTHAFARTRYWLAMSGGGHANPHLAATMSAETTDHDDSQSDDHPWRERLFAASSAQRTDLLLSLVRDQVQRLLGYAAEEIDVDRGLLELGLSSVTGVELSRRLSTATGLRLPATLIFDHGTVAAIVKQLTALVADAADAADTTPGSPGHGVATAADFERLERALATPSAERSERERVTAGLERLLRLWRSDDGRADGALSDPGRPDGGLPDLRSAGVDEVLSFIRDDLGLDDALDGH
ncbi:SDR family NAD(P)-dependent oxidoreductase [Catenulispora yoronensis]